MAINYLKWRAWPFISKNIIPLHLKILFGKFDWKGRVVLEMKIFNSFSYNVFYFAIISNWKRAWPFICTNLNPLYSRMLCTKFGWNWQSGSGIEDFWKFFPIIFNISLIISPWRKAWLFICTNLKPLYSKMLYAKLGWNWSSGSGGDF